MSKIRARGDLIISQQLTGSKLYDPSERGNEPGGFGVSLPGAPEDIRRLSQDTDESTLSCKLLVILKRF